MAELPTFRATVPLRCFEPKVIAGSQEICGRPARWTREGQAPMAGYFCDGCMRPGDVPIGDTALVRRVSLVAEVVFAGASWSDTTARIDALARLERAVQEAGGVLNLHQATSTLGHYTPSAPLAAANASRGDRR